MAKGRVKGAFCMRRWMCEDAERVLDVESVKNEVVDVVIKFQSGAVDSRN